MMLRDWANLRIELLELIAERLVPNFVDLIRFRSVCKSWGSISLNQPPNPTPQLPWLLLSSDDKTIATPRCHFFSLSDNRVYSIPLSESFRNCCYRSSHGWLFMVDNDRNCSLFDPLTGVGLVLPSLQSFLPPKSRFTISENWVVKAAFSSAPNANATDVCSIMVIMGIIGGLMFSESGGRAWRRVSDQRHRFEDVIYFKGNFYAVDCNGRIVVCDLSTGPVLVTTKIEQGSRLKAAKNYLVESSGELLLIRRFRGMELRRTIQFEVVRQDPISKEWIHVENLRGHTLFLGHNRSVSLLASDFFGCRGDCIYFTDNCFIDFSFGSKEPHDVGIFNLADEHIEPLPGYSCDSQFSKQQPMWLTPSP